MIKYRVVKSRFTLASQQEFILVLLINVSFICIISNMNNHKPTFLHPCTRREKWFSFVWFTSVREIVQSTTVGKP